MDIQTKDYLELQANKDMRTEAKELAMVEEGRVFRLDHSLWDAIVKLAEDYAEEVVTIRS